MPVMDTDSTPPNPHPVIRDCAETTGISPQKVEQAVGIALRELEHSSGTSLLREILDRIPEARLWMSSSPRPKKSLLGGLAGAVGGQQSRMIAELSQGLRRIGIPVSEHRALAKALSDAAEKQAPELKDAFERMFRG